MISDFNYTGHCYLNGYLNEIVDNGEITKDPDFNFVEKYILFYTFYVFAIIFSCINIAFLAWQAYLCLRDIC